jgi:predicted CoA-binding protein
MSDWRANLLTEDTAIRDLLASSRRIAVLGIKTEAQASKPAFQIPKYLKEVGYEVIPVPVYFPEVEEILGEPVYRKLIDIPGPIDIVDVFRKPGDIPAHLPDILAKRPRAVWFQLGIRNDDAAESLAREGILVVQDRCIGVEHRRLL